MTREQTPDVEIAKGCYTEIRKLLAPKDVHWLDELCAALRKSPTPDGWRDISSAPTDGTEVDLFGYLDYDLLETRLTDCEYKYGNWFYFRDGKMNPVSDIGFNPTHWMPLPQPPMQSRGE